MTKYIEKYETSVAEHKYREICTRFGCYLYSSQHSFEQLNNKTVYIYLLSFVDPNALTKTVTSVVLGHWLREKPSSGPCGCWEPEDC